MHLEETRRMKRTAIALPFTDSVDLPPSPPPPTSKWLPMLQQPCVPSKSKRWYYLWDIFSVNFFLRISRTHALAHNISFLLFNFTPYLPFLDKFRFSFFQHVCLPPLREHIIFFYQNQNISTKSHWGRRRRRRTVSSYPYAQFLVQWRTPSVRKW